MSTQSKTRIAIDAMGGDYAPFSIVAGAVLAQQAYGDDVELTLVGDKAQIETELKNLNASEMPIKCCTARRLSTWPRSPPNRFARNPTRR